MPEPHTAGSDKVKLNRAIVRPSFPFPSLLDVKNFISHKSRYFCKLDFSDCYSQFKLHKDSRHLTQFMTEWGRYQYRTLPQGMSNSGDICNEKLSKAFASMDPEKFLRVIDDCLLQAETLDELYNLIDQALSLCKKHGIVVSITKF